MDIKAFELELTRMAIFWGALELIGFLVGLWMLYLVIKNAIRNGINESNLTNNWSNTAKTAIEKEAIARTIPDMKAEK